MWDVPGPGLESMSPALADGFLTTVPPGKPQLAHFKHMDICDFLTGFQCFDNIFKFIACLSLRGIVLLR